MPTYDLIVVGAGPAGTSAAISAAHGGARVLLLERGRLPRHKVCGEFVSAESLDLLGTLLDDRNSALLHEALRIPRARLFLDGHGLEIPVDPHAASIARLDLDLALWQSAQSAGVDARPQTNVQSVKGCGPFRIASTAGEFESHALINASGRWSNLSPPAGQRQQEKWLGIKAHFAESAPPPSVDLYFFEGGYCGVQPVRLRGESDTGRINVAAMVRADVASALPEVLAQSLPLRERSLSWSPLSETIATSPLIFREPCPRRDDILLAGDAAGFVDPFVGDGISLAVRSGSLAAECLQKFFRGQVSLAEALQSYVELYNRDFLPVFRASSRVRKLLRLPRLLRQAFLVMLEKNPALTRLVVKSTR